jgi:hypothetical protein
MYTATYDAVFPKRWSSLHPHVHTGSVAICLFTQCCYRVRNTEPLSTAQHSNCCVFKTDAEQGSWVSVVSERQRFDPRQRQRTFPQVSASRPALGPTELPLQWLPGVLPRGQSTAGAWRWPLTSKVKNAWSCTSTPPYVSMARCLVKHQKLYLYSTLTAVSK